MKYRKFGKLDWESSILGLGVMRLPLVGSDLTRIDETQSVRMIRHAIDQGVNYLDLGFPWDMKQHEPVVLTVRNALRDGYRDKIRIALTVPARLIASRSDFDLRLNEQLEWLEVDTVDFCLLGRLNRENWPRLLGLGALDWIEGAMKDGRIDKAGFSFHDHYQVLKSILDSYDKWTVGQFQYSYMDVDHDPGVSGINYAAERGLAVVVMEPLRGGRLTKRPPETVARVWAKARQGRTLAEWGLRFVWNLSSVSTVVCDMGSMEQLAENLSIAESAEVDGLTVQEEVLISQVREEYRKLRHIPCPSCRPCMPCPMDIDVPRLFEVYNDALMYDDLETARSICRDEQLYPQNCTECRLCENRCAKRLPIVDWVTKVRELLGVCP
jgi:uncharacterized protein